MAKINRVIDNAALQDPDQIKSVEYNPQSGAQKSLTVGPRLIPIPIVAAGTPSFTTDVSGKVALPYLGATLAIYNNSGTVGNVTVGETSANTSLLAIGATDANGHVGVACQPNTWTYLSMGNRQWIISNATTTVVYMIEDPTTMAQESGPYAQVQDPRTWLPVNS